MNRNTLLKIVNPIMFLSALVQIITGLIIFFNLFMTKISTFVEIHEHNGILLTVLILVHFSLNWGWVKASFIRK